MCSCCNVYGHYTHEFPLLPQIHKVWEAQPIAPPLLPASSQLTMITDPFTHQGYPTDQPTPSQATLLPPPSGCHDYHILMMNLMM